MSGKKKMTPEVYEEKRNSLIALLGECSERLDDQAEATKEALGGVCETTGERLDAIADDIRRNSFEIVLVGEFQGGKSTTFDAICDGREISPRGIGIKTSACRISAQSIPETEDEYAILNWKSDDELMLTMYDLVRDFVRDSLADDEEAVRLFPYDPPEKMPSLSNRRVRELAKQAISQEWEIYRNAPGAYGGEESGRLDLLKMSTLILKYHGTPELERLRKRERVGIGEIRPVVVFPQDWEPRWEKGGENAAWSLDEAAFAFLGSVDCHIHCRYLERLGCVVTDCPGLFAGPWDTKVAEEAMMRADAILYLMRGDKAIGDEDMKALRQIMRLQQGDKLFFAINAKGSVSSNDLGVRSVRQNVLENLRKTDLAKITGIGVKSVKGAEDLEVFNALLAFKSREAPQGEEAFKSWRKDVTKALQDYLGLSFFDDEERLRMMEMVSDRKKLAAVSDFPAILRKIETDITSRKFETVLVDRGTKQIENALKGIDGGLRRLEMAAKANLDAVKAAIEKARRKLAEFQEFVEEGMRKVLNEAGDAEAVCRGCYDSVFIDNVRGYANEVSDAIANELARDFRNLLSLGWEGAKNAAKKLGNSILNWFRSEKKKFVPDDTKFKAILGTPIRSAMCRVAAEGMHGWVVRVSQGLDNHFSVTYGCSLKCLQEEIAKRWETTVDDLEAWCGILDGINMDVTRIGAIHGATRILNGVESSEIKELAHGLSLWTSIFLVLWVGILGPICGIVETVKEFFERPCSNFNIRGHIERQVQSGIAPKLRQTLETAFCDSGNREEVLAEINGKVLRRILDGILENCRDALADQRRRFEENVARLLRKYELALEERRRIARIAREVRETVVAPMQTKATAFNEGLLPYFDRNDG